MSLALATETYQAQLELKRSAFNRLRMAEGDYDEFKRLSRLVDELWEDLERAWVVLREAWKTNRAA